MTEAKLERLGAHAFEKEPEKIFSLLERDGGVIVEPFLAPDLLGRLNADLDDLVASWPAGSRSSSHLWQSFHGRNTKRFCGLAARSRAFVDLLEHPLLEGYADHFLLPSCGSYWINTTQMMVVGPGEPAQHLHRDEGNWPHFAWGGPELTVSAIFALVDFTEENGATRVAPGSHRWESAQREPEPAEITAAEMAAGSVLLYTGKVLHGAGENRTRETWRRGMHLSFVLGWLRPEENHYLAVPLEVARTLPPRVRSLLGYSSYHPSVPGGRLGLVDFEDAELALEARSGR